MSNKLSKLININIPILLGALSVSLPVYSTQIEPFEDTTAEIGRGFGSSYNRYSWSMAGFNDDLYVGTLNSQIDVPRIAMGALNGTISLDALSNGNILDMTGAFVDSSGGEIWRLNTGSGQWSQVFDAPDSEIGFRKMVSHDGALFAGSVDYQNGTRILTSLDGSSWSALNGGPTSNPSNKSIRTMLSHEGKLFIGTENDNEGAELWTWDGSNWELIEKFADGSVAELKSHKGKLYVGTWNFDGLTKGRFGLYNSDDGKTFSDVTPEFEGSDELANLGVMQLQELNDELVLTTVNFVDGFTMLRSPNADDPNGWETVTVDGLGDPDNKYGWSSIVIDGVMYVGTFNTGLQGGALHPLPVPLDGRGKIFKSTDGMNWEVVVDDGFDKFNYGIRTMATVNDELYVGTASNLILFDPMAYDWDEFIAENEGFFGNFEVDLVSMLENKDFRGLYNHFAGHHPELEEFFSSFDFELPSLGTQVWKAKINPTAVSEPNILALMLLGLAGITLRNKRKKTS